MANFWMVRAGEGGFLVDDFERTKHIAIGWGEAHAFDEITSLEQMRRRIDETYPDMKPGARVNSASMTWKFRGVMKPKDRVVTYDPPRREYLVGTITGEYQYSPGVVLDFNHVRTVEWQGRVSRDDLTPASRNTLGSTLTVFEPGAEVLRELEHALGQRKAPTRHEHSADVEEIEEDWQVIRRDVLGRAHEFIKDRILALSPEDMEHVVAALLRGMGYKARVTAKGPDRGRDVIASPDGLGFQHPRIVAEVKHRPREAMGSQQIRSFLGGLRTDDRGLFVSTGGFTREAKYEADRASFPVTLVDLDELAALVVEHYENFDSDGRSLLPLMKVYWPAS